MVNHIASLHPATANCPRHWHPPPGRANAPLKQVPKYGSNTSNTVDSIREHALEERKLSYASLLRTFWAETMEAYYQRWREDAKARWYFRLIWHWHSNVRRRWIGEGRGIWPLVKVTIVSAQKSARGWHISSRPSRACYRMLSMSSIVLLVLRAILWDWSWEAFRISVGAAAVDRAKALCGGIWLTGSS